MRKIKISTWLSILSLLTLIGCYTFVSQTTVMSTAPTWTGANHYATGGGINVVGLAGQDIYRISGTTEYIWDDFLIEEFGGPYVLTGIAQSHTMGHHEHTFVHGNLVGQTNNLDLFYTYQSIPYSMERIVPWNASFYKDGQTFNLVQICELAASADRTFGHPYEASSHLYMSFRACSSTGTCTGGVMEVTFDTGINYWWPKSTGTGEQVWIHKPNGGRFSNECMPIAVTGMGDQSKQYLVVGDPSWDEISVFDASSIASGETSSLRTSDSAFSIRDLTIEGRGDGSVDYGVLVTLWGSSSGARLEHRIITNGNLPNDPPHLIESMPSNVELIASRGMGAEWTYEYLYTFGSQVMRRQYEQ